MSGSIRTKSKALRFVLLAAAIISAPLLGSASLLAEAQSNARSRCASTTLSDDDSIAGCNEAIKANPQDSILWYNRGVSWRKKGDLDRAISDYSEALRLNPKYANAYVNRGNAWKDKGNLDQAFADYNEAISIDPGNSRAYYNRGNAWDDKRDYDRAIADFSQAIKLNPKYSVAYFNRGLAWKRKRDFDHAISDFTESIKLDPNDATAYFQRGDCYDETRSYDSAIADYNKAINLDPNYARAYVYRGIAWSNKGNYDGAIADYDKAIKLNPKYALAYNNRGIAWKNKGDYDRAIADYTEAIGVDPEHGSAYYNRALVLERKNELQRALADLRRFKELAPADADGQRALTRVTAALGIAAPPSPPQQPKPAIAAPTGGSNQRVALLIGNGQYQNVSVLRNPANDARTVASTLKAAGFASVTIRTDLTREGIISALRDFAVVADTADWAMLYYSGHGIEFGGANYMIPVDARLRVDRDIDLEAVDVGKVLNAIEGAKKLRLVILDACRDNPFLNQMRRTTATRSVGQGLARMEPEAGTLVVYAAKHGETALDGSGSNSPFVEALVKHIPTPNLEVRRLFDLVRDDVMETTGRKQQPFSYGSLSGREDYYFVRR